MAAAQGLPLIVVLQNNQVALGTPYSVHSRVPLQKLAGAYVDGEPYECRGNNVLDVHAATVLASAQCREGRGPAIIVAETGRMGGHATHDESDARKLLPAEHFEYWGRRDPVGVYESYLEDRLATEGDRDAAISELQRIESEATAEIDAAAEAALQSRGTAPATPETVEEGVYADEAPEGPEPRPDCSSSSAPAESGSAAASR